MDLITVINPKSFVSLYKKKQLVSSYILGPYGWNFKSFYTYFCLWLTFHSYPNTSFASEWLFIFIYTYILPLSDFLTLHTLVCCLNVRISFRNKDKKKTLCTKMIRYLVKDIEYLLYCFPEVFPPPGSWRSCWSYRFPGKKIPYVWWNWQRSNEAI